MTAGARLSWARTLLLPLPLALAPLAAVAQTTVPLLPVPPLPSGPQAPVEPGQPVYPGETVTGRPRPEFDPIGSRLGSFFWFPRAEIDESYNSNIFAIPSATSDFITGLGPAFDLLSNFRRNALNLHADALNQIYAEHPAQNTQTGSVTVDGRLDATALSSFYGSAQAAHLAVPRTSPTSPGNAAEPVTYNNYTASAGYQQSGLRFGYAANVAISETQYNGVPMVGGGILPQSAQNTTISEAVLRTDYQIIPDYFGYFRAEGDLTDYEHTAPGGVRFNSTGYRADIGLQILPRHIIYGDVYVGYLAQLFAVSGLGSIAAADAGGRLTWNVTRLTTLTFTGLRTPVVSNPSIGTTGAGYLASNVAANVDHELLRYLLVNLNASFENDAFQGVTRSDDVFSVGAGLKYLINRNLYLGASYSFQQRTSSLPGASYDQSIVMVRLSTQY